MHIPYFADFYHICICKIDEITPLKRTAFLSPKQRYTFQIPPRGAASSLRGTGVPPAGMGGVTLSTWAITAPAPPLQSRAAPGFPGPCGCGPRRCRYPVVWGQNPAGGMGGKHRGSPASRVPEVDGDLYGVPGALEISRSGLSSPGGVSFGKRKKKNQLVWSFVAVLVSARLQMR